MCDTDNIVQNEDWSYYTNAEYSEAKNELEGGYEEPGILGKLSDKFFSWLHNKTEGKD